MPELRQDPVTRDWVIVSPERASRPKDGVAGPSRGTDGCPFCPGQEHATPAEIERLADERGNWLVRVVPNRYPALSGEDGEAPAAERTPAGWRRLPGHGHHEVIIETPDHDESPATIGHQQLRRVLGICVRRYQALACAQGVRQVVLFRNRGRRAGTSLAHPHSQIVATPVVSPETRWRLSEEIEFYDANGRCGICYVTERECLCAQRIVHASRDFVTLAPYASRVAFHLQLIPRRHMAMFSEVAAAELDDLAAHLGTVLWALHAVLEDPDYNLVVVTPPLDQVHRQANHWFIDILPRLTTPAGFELGSRIVIIAQPPEQAAQALRAAIDREPARC